MTPLDTRKEAIWELENLPRLDRDCHRMMNIFILRTEMRLLGLLSMRLRRRTAHTCSDKQHQQNLKLCHKPNMLSHPNYHQK